MIQRACQAQANIGENLGNSSGVLAAFPNPGEASICVVARGGNQGDPGVLVDQIHDLDASIHVIPVILQETQRIHPQVAASQQAGEGDCIVDSLGKGGDSSCL